MFYDSGGSIFDGQVRIWRISEVAKMDQKGDLLVGKHGPETWLASIHFQTSP